MTSPEISRRCLGCGASVRAGARFCPQCGKEMVGEAAAGEGEGKATGEAPPAVPPAPGSGRGATASLEDSWNRWQESLRQPTTGGLKPPGEARGGGGRTQPAPHDAATLYDAATPRDAAPARDDGGPQTVVGRPAPSVTADIPASRTAAETPAQKTAAERPAPGGEADSPARPQPFRRPAGGGPGARLKDGPAESAAAPGQESERGGGEVPRGRRAAAVKEAVRPRVEKVREASMGVLEGAAEDSGLRFVLVSVALFLLFLFLLLLNSWLK